VCENLDRVLAAVLAATAQLRDVDLNLKLANRDRNLRELIHDIFYKALTWASEDGSVSARDDATQKREAARYPDVLSVRRYGEASRAILRERFSSERTDYIRFVETADGPMSLGHALTWIADHSAHHLRQVYWLMEHELRISPEDPLDLAALPGITLPQALW
jgi:uncharacterized damage-inducible protein DinB